MVCDPITKDAGLSKHTIYNVKGMDNFGQFDIYRRYNDFHALRDYLVIKWPGCYIPPIPVFNHCHLYDISQKNLQVEMMIK